MVRIYAPSHAVMFTEKMGHVVFMQIEGPGSASIIAGI